MQLLKEITFSPSSPSSSFQAWSAPSLPYSVFFFSRSFSSFDWQMTKSIVNKQDRRVKNWLKVVFYNNKLCARSRSLMHRINYKSMLSVCLLTRKISQRVKFNCLPSTTPEWGWNETMLSWKTPAFEDSFSFSLSKWSILKAKKDIKVINILPIKSKNKTFKVKGC